MSLIRSICAKLPGMPEAGSLVVVVGSGSSGLAAARLLYACGYRVRILDKKKDGFSESFRMTAAQYGFELVSGEHRKEQFADAALVVPSPGVPMRVLEPLLQGLQADCFSELELASRFLNGEGVIAVTGTSGKTTTVSLAAAMLREAGVRIFLGGNIGTPLSEYVLQLDQGEQRAEVVVLEVSSFQLQGCRSFHPHVGVMLNLSENHLDQHRDMAEYADSKFKLFQCQTGDDVAIFGERLQAEAAKRHIRAHVEFFHDSGRFSKTRLLGAHNRLNLEAAFAAVGEYGVTEAQAKKVAASFAPLAHRLESVAEVDGVLYVEDSKCTTVEALRVALQSFKRPVLLLAGGVFKGGDLRGLEPELRKHVKAVGLFGANRDIFSAAWQDIVPVSWNPKLPEALDALRGIARPGDVILLAPATSSFDLYPDYKARGAHFQALIKDIERAAEQKHA